MLQTEVFDVWEDGTKLIRTWSDAGFYIEQVGTGALYGEAIDPDFMKRTYIETNIPLEPEEPEELEL